MDGAPTVVHVVPYYPPHTGGMERVTAELVRELPAHGVRALVITSDLGSAGVGPTAEPGVLRLPTREFAHTPLMRGLVRALRAIPPGSVVHAHVAHAFVPDIVTAVARRRGHHVVAHYHLDVDPTGLIGRLLLRPYQRTLLRRTLRQADMVLVPTTDYAQIVIGTFGVDPGRVEVLPNGTTFDVVGGGREAPGSDGSPASSSWRLVSVGRLNDQKNHAGLLEACARLRALEPSLDWTLDIYGDGELKKQLEQDVVRLGLGNRVRLRGDGFTPAQISAAYDAADLFVLATRKESFGVVYVEAMARGLPIVTTDVPGTRNVVLDGRTGLLAAPSPDAFAQVVLRLVRDPVLYRQLSVAGVQAAGGYRWPEIAAKLAGLYRRLLGADQSLL